VCSQSRGPVRQCTLEKGPQELHTTGSKVTPGDTHGGKTPPALEIVNPLGANQKCCPSPYPRNDQGPVTSSLRPQVQAQPGNSYHNHHHSRQTTLDAKKICLPLLRFSPTILAKTQHGCCKALRSNPTVLGHSLVLMATASIGWYKNERVVPCSVPRWY
jgi:hypothetical protein